jgi:aromatic ring-opening dioxygenase catalytic subunit (LigB family)
VQGTERPRTIVVEDAHWVDARRSTS